MDASAETELVAHRRLPFRKRYFAQRMIYPWERPSIMRKHIYTGAMGTLYFHLIAGMFFIYFGNRIGVTRFQWGLMGGISSFLLSAQLLGALITQRAGRRKVLWFWAAVVQRGVRLLGIFAALALWQLDRPQASVVLIVAVCVANFFSAIAFPPWMSWFADIIPEEGHGQFVGRRTWWITLTVIAVVVPVGYLFDRTPEAWKLPAVVGMFTGATVIGMLDIFIHGTIPEPRMVLGERGHFLDSLLEPIRDRRFRPWLIFNVCWTFAMTLGGALCTVYLIEDLKIKDNMLGGAIALTVFMLLGALFTVRWTGRLVDHHGPKRVLLWAHLAWSFLPVFWFVATPGTAIFWVSCASLLGGAAGTAGFTAANKLITRFPPPGHCVAMYVAVSSSLGSLAGGLGVISAGTVLKVLSDWHWMMMGMSLCAFHLLFAASFCLRLSSTTLLIRRIHNPDRKQPTP